MVGEEDMTAEKEDVVTPGAAAAVEPAAVGRRGQRCSKVWLIFQATFECILQVLKLDVQEVFSILI